MSENLPPNLDQMAKDYRMIRSNQPSMTSEEMRAQLEGNRASYAERTKRTTAFRLNPDGGDPIPIPPPTEEQQRSMDEQKERMFTPDGQLRRVVELREAWQTAQSKPGVSIVETDQS